MGQAGDIAVLGAGIGGLAIATLLAGEGRRVLVFDRFEAPRAVGSGLMIQPTGRAVLERMGLWENLAPLCAPIDRLIGRNEQDRRVLDVRFAALGTGRQGFGTLRGTLFETLLEAAREAGATLLPQSDIEGADAERGTLRLNGGREAGPFALIVDALGLRSPLTKDPRRELPYGALWATLPWPVNGDFDPAALEQRYRAASRMAGVMASGRPSPGAPKTVTYFWSIKAAQAKDWRAAPLESWRNEAEALWPQTAPLLAQITSHDQLTFARYRHRTHRRPVSGPRLVHVGDSWHAASPQLGQGANMALLDAYALALALKHHRGEAALAAYARARQGHVALYQAMSRAFTPVYQSDGRALPWLRDRVAAPLMGLWPAPLLLAATVSGALGAPLKRLELR